MCVLFRGFSTRMCKESKDRGERRVARGTEKRQRGRGHAINARCGRLALTSFVVIVSVRTERQTGPVI